MYTFVNETYAVNVKVVLKAISETKFSDQINPQNLMKDRILLPFQDY